MKNGNSFIRNVKAAAIVSYIYTSDDMMYDSAAHVSRKSRAEGQ